MRHRQKGSRLNRKSAQKKALLRNLVTSLILNEKMVTTEAKAKALVPVFDRLVVKCKNYDEMNAIRALQEVVFGAKAQKKMLLEIVPRLADRNSGFTSAIKIGSRNGDNAPVVQIEIIGRAKPVIETPVIVKETIAKTEEKEEESIDIKKEEKKTVKKETKKKAAPKKKPAAKKAEKISE